MSSFFYHFLFLYLYTPIFDQVGSNVLLCGIYKSKIFSLQAQNPVGSSETSIIVA